MDYDAENKIVKKYIKDVEGKYSVSLTKRLFKFAIRAFALLKTIRKEKDYDVFRYQLSKSATSVGANYEEAQSSSEKEFVQKLRIALREANESKYWYKIIDKLEIYKTDDLISLLKESNEILTKEGLIK